MLIWQNIFKWNHLVRAVSAVRLAVADVGSLHALIATTGLLVAHTAGGASVLERSMLLELLGSI
jgi:hypothetical protein